MFHLIEAQSFKIYFFHSSGFIKFTFFTQVALWLPFLDKEVKVSVVFLRSVDQISSQN